MPIAGPPNTGAPLIGFSNSMGHPVQTPCLVALQPPWVECNRQVTPSPPVFPNSYLSRFLCRLPARVVRYVFVPWAVRPSLDCPPKRVKGVEPSSIAWKATALPLSYTRNTVVVIRKMGGTGFEPVKALPSDLQSDPFDRSGNPPFIFGFAVGRRQPRRAKLLVLSTLWPDHAPRDGLISTSQLGGFWHPPSYELAEGLEPTTC